MELLSLLEEKFFFKQLFKKNKPSRIFLNNTRGSNEYLTKLSKNLRHRAILLLTER